MDVSNEGKGVTPIELRDVARSNKPGLTVVAKATLIVGKQSHDQVAPLWISRRRRGSAAQPRVLIRLCAAEVGEVVKALVVDDVTRCSDDWDHVCVRVQGAENRLPVFQQGGG